jgi:tRNA(Ile)-lysidine synthase
LPGARLDRADTPALIGEAAASSRFGIAVSGGPDSMALLWLARRAFPGRVAAATVDHGLRAESAAEAVLVGEACVGLGIDHAILHPDAPITGSLQAGARTARYRLLEQWRLTGRIDWLMTAHHADDQLETLVMRLNRASGLTGLSGIRARHGAILRPLLGTRRADLAAVVKTAGLPSVDDPSNSLVRFDRVRVRQALAAGSPIDAVAASASAAHLAEAETALAWAAERLAGERLTHGDDGTMLLVDALPPDLRRRLVLIALQQVAPSVDPPRGAALDEAIARVRAGEKSMLGDVLIAPDRTNPALWRFAPAPPRRA